MGKRVLVVDDEKLIVKGIRFSLLQDGLEVDCAYDGEEALEYARNNQYDLILLDRQRQQVFQHIPILRFSQIQILKCLYIWKCKHPHICIFAYLHM